MSETSRRSLLGFLLGTTAAAATLSPTPAHANEDDDVIDGGTP